MTNFFKTENLTIDEMINDLFINSIKNKYAQKRYENALKIAENNNDCGKFGDILELYCVPVNSTKIGIAKQKRVDNYILIYSPSMEKPKKVSCEIKSNGGRIGHTSGQYIVYYNIACGLRLCKKDIFLNKIYEYNARKAIKNKNYNYIEDGIRLNKKMISFLLTCPKYNRNDVNIITD